MKEMDKEERDREGGKESCTSRSNKTRRRRRWTKRMKRKRRRGE